MGRMQVFFKTLNSSKGVEVWKIFALDSFLVNGGIDSVIVALDLDLNNKVVEVNLESNVGGSWLHCSLVYRMMRWTQDVFWVFRHFLFLKFSLDNCETESCYREGRIDNSLIFNELRGRAAQRCKSLIINNLAMGRKKPTPKSGLVALGSYSASTLSIHSSRSLRSSFCLLQCSISAM